MTEPDLLESFEDLSTPLIFDACLRAGAAHRLAPFGLQPAIAETRTAGPVRPAIHAGSVDVFLEAIDQAVPGDVLVIDNAGRTDEGCIGDLIVIEAQAAGLAGLVVWGTHRDGPEIRAIGLPVFSYGTCPAGPVRLDPRPPEALERARFGDHSVTGADVVFADTDGAIFLAAADAGRVLDAAREIRRVERRQAERVLAGESLRAQFGFAGYRAERESDPELTFRAYLRRKGGAIEE